MKLKIEGVKEELRNYNIIFCETCNDLIKYSVCEAPKPACYYSVCECCPGSEAVIEKLKTTLSECGVQEIAYKQWTSTDRYGILQLICEINYI